tara:strand:+ start:102 stop:302 length:201 start_codon:yes stop_codon:yes gene_type:complete
MILFLDVSITLFFIKFFLEALVLYIGGKIFLTKISAISYFIWNLTQPFYIPIVAIGGLIGKFRWKQ